MSERTDELLDEIVRLIVVSLRTNMETQTEAITLLTQAGFSAPRIAELLGAKPNTVRKAQTRAQKGKSNGQP